MVRVNGELGPEFEVTAGVRQGCVIAPTLFNVFIDMVVRKALMRMPENCVAFESRCKGRLSLAPMHISSC